MHNGWLAFESATGERRRLVPAPENWDALTDHEIARLIPQAERIVAFTLPLA
jgi:hypothetical protein